MSRGLKALARVKYFMSQNCKHWKQDVGYIEEELKAGEKHKKALEIIKNKRVQVEYLAFIVHDYKYCATEEQVELYNKKCARWNVLTKDEFDLLKEVLQ